MYWQENIYWQVSIARNKRIDWVEEHISKSKSKLYSMIWVNMHVYIFKYKEKSLDGWTSNHLHMISGENCWNLISTRK